MQAAIQNWLLCQIANKPVEPVSTFKVYRALLTQVGVNAPTAVVLENTLGGVPIWEYQLPGPGLYNCVLAGAFPVGKTFVLTGNSDNTDTAVFGYSIAALGDAVNVQTLALGVLSDDVLDNTAIQILVYP